MKVNTLFSSVVKTVSKKMKSVRLKGYRGIDKKKKLEHIRIKLYDREFSNRLKDIYRNFPSIDDLPAFIYTMLDASIGVNNLKQSLGRIKGILKVLEAIRNEAFYEIYKSKSEKDLIRARKKYIARLYDALKEIEEDLLRVSRARSELRKIPPVDTSKPTVVIAGFPNAGKSTLLKALTGSEPEIAPYPFTTKNILIGHFSDGYRLVQVLDTPGILDRPPEHMKVEEKRALASMKHLADLIVFIVDPFQDIESQKNLLNSLQASIEKTFVTVIGKGDLIEEPPDIEHSMVVSPLTGKNVDRLKSLIAKKLEGIKWQ